MDKQQLRLTTASLLIVTFFVTSCYLMSNVNPSLLKKLHVISDTSVHKIAARETRLKDSAHENYEYPNRIRILAIRHVVPPILNPFAQESLFVTENDLKNIATEEQISGFIESINKKKQLKLNYHNGSVLLRFFNDILKSKLEIAFSRNEFPLQKDPRAFRIKIQTPCDERQISAEQVRINIASINSLLSDGKYECTDLSFVKDTTKYDETSVTDTVPKLETIHNNFFANITTDFLREDKVIEKLKDESLIIKSPDSSVNPKYIKIMELNESNVRNITAEKISELVQHFSNTTEHQHETIINTECTVEIPVFTATEIEEEETAVEGVSDFLEYSKDLLNTTLQNSSSANTSQDTSITSNNKINNLLKIRSDDKDNLIHEGNSNKDQLNANNEEQAINNSFNIKRANEESLSDAQSSTKPKYAELSLEDLTLRIAGRT